MKGLSILTTSILISSKMHFSFVNSVVAVFTFSCYNLTAQLLTYEIINLDSLVYHLRGFGWLIMLVYEVLSNKFRTWADKLICSVLKCLVRHFTDLFKGPSFLFQKTFILSSQNNAENSGSCSLTEVKAVSSFVITYMGDHLGTLGTIKKKSLQSQMFQF